MQELDFGREAGLPNVEGFTHARPAVERRAAAPGPAAVGDVRSQRAAAPPLAVIAEAGPSEGIGAVAAAGSAPGMTGDAGNAQPSTVGPGLTTGVHFVGGVPTEGRISRTQASEANPAVPASSSGAGLTQGLLGSGWASGGSNTDPGRVPGAAPAAGLGPHAFTS